MEGLDFTSKVVIVTGASSGIGAETARAFAERGASLTLVGRNQVKLSKTAEYCEAKRGVPPLCVLVDLTYPGSCEQVITKTFDTYGKIDVLINNAGKLLMSSIFDKSIEVFDELMAINLRVPYYLTQLSLPHLAKTKGNVVNVGYPILNKHRPGFLPYTLSKSALQTFTKHAAAELTPEGVRINCVSPGVTRTNILENLNIQQRFHPSVYNFIAETMPTGRVMEPREVAMLILLTASDTFPNMSGSNILMDGAVSTV